MTPAANNTLSKIRSELDGEVRMLCDDIERGVVGCAYFPKPTDASEEPADWGRISEPAIVVISYQGEAFWFPSHLQNEKGRSALAELAKHSHLMGVSNVR